MKSFYRVISLIMAVLLISGIAVIGASADTDSGLISGTFKMHVAFSPETKTETYYYSDDYFRQSGTAADAHLRTMSAALAFTIYNKSDNPDTVFGKIPKEIGFDNIKTYDLDSLTSSTMGVLFASKVIDGKPVVMVMLRSDDYDNEWASNLLAGESGDAKGFSDSAALITNRLKKYLSDNSISNPKFWVTGYSRGGAVANLIGKDLNEHLEEYGTTADDIYVYTFEAPNSSSDYTTYSNIHNVVDCRDLIPYVYPENWGMTNNGVTEEIGNPDDTMMSKKFDLFSESHMADCGEVKISEFLKDFVSFLGTNISRETYCQKIEPYASSIADMYFSLDEGSRTAFVEFFKACMDKALEDGEMIVALMSIIAEESGPDEIDALVGKIQALLDDTAEEKGKPVSDESFAYIRNAVEPLVNAIAPVIKADCAQVFSGGPMLYYIMSLAGNVGDIISYHFNYNVFSLLKAADSYYPAEADTEATEATEATETTETTAATEATEATEASKATEATQAAETTAATEAAEATTATEATGATRATEPTQPKVTSIKLTAAKKTIYVNDSTTVKATVTNPVGKTTFKSGNTKIATVSAAGKVVGKKAGTVTITAKNNGKSASVKIKVVKRANTITAKAKTITLNKGYKTTKFSKAKAFNVKNAKGAVVFKKAKGNGKITVTSKGVVTVKKGLKKGKYKVTVKVTAKGNAAYTSKTKTVTLTVIVK